MLCRVEMVNSEQRYGRFYRWRMLHLQGGLKGTIIIMAVLMVLAVAMLYTSNTNPMFILLIVAAVLGYFIYQLYIKPNSMFRKRPGAAMETEVYIFTENGFTLNVKNEESGTSDHSSSQYSVLTSAVETGGDFILFTSPTQGYMIEKTAFTNGSPDELREVLKQKMGKKFKTRQK